MQQIHEKGTGTDQDPKLTDLVRSEPIIDLLQSVAPDFWILTEHERVEWVNNLWNLDTMKLRVPSPPLPLPPPVPPKGPPVEPFQVPVERKDEQEEEEEEEDPLPPTPIKRKPTQRSLRRAKRTEVQVAEDTKLGTTNLPRRRKKLFSPVSHI